MRNARGPVVVCLKRAGDGDISFGDSGRGRALRARREHHESKSFLFSSEEVRQKAHSFAGAPENHVAHGILVTRDDEQRNLKKCVSDGVTTSRASAAEGRVGLSDALSVSPPPHHSLRISLSDRRVT